MSFKRTMRVLTVEMSLTNRIITQVKNATRNILSEDEERHFRPTDAELIHFYGELRAYYEGKEGLADLYDELCGGGTYQTVLETLCETMTGNKQNNAYLQEVTAMSHRYGNIIPSFFNEIYRICDMNDCGRLTPHEEFAVELLIEKCAEYVAHFILEKVEADIAEQEEIDKLNGEEEEPNQFVCQNCGEDLFVREIKNMLCDECDRQDDINRAIDAEADARWASISQDEMAKA